MDVKTKYKYFMKLTDVNNHALEELSCIRRCLTDGRKGASDHFFRALDCARAMANNLGKIKNREDIQLVMDKIAEVGAAGEPVASSIDLAVKQGYSDTGLASDIAKKLSGSIEALSKKMQDSSKKSFNIKNAKTLHDVIRYLHQKGVEEMFSYKNVSTYESSMQHFELPHDAFLHVINLGGKAFKESIIEEPGKIGLLPLRAIVEFYSGSQSEDKNDSETFYVFAFGDRLLSQFLLGEHYGELEAKIVKEESENFIRFMFKDTAGYKNSKKRTKYTRAVLDRLGFEVKGQGIITKALMKGKNEKKSYTTLKELLRLTASTSDLDLDSSCIEHYPKKAVDAFFEGVTNMHDYLRKCKDEGVAYDKN